jgi:uncharacterized DUF497 family protein
VEGEERTVIDVERGVEYDLIKHQAAVAERGFGFDFAAKVWDGRTVTVSAKTVEGEERFVTVGQIGRAIFAVIWTWRADRRRIISARIASRKERKVL